MEAWSSIKFTTNEESIVNTGRSTLTEDENRFTLCLVGFIWSKSSFNHGAFRTTITQLWKMRHGLEIKELGKNLFMFQFFHWKDKERVLAGEPWWFDKKLLCLKEITGDERPSSMKPQSTPFWVRIYDLPLAQRNIETTTAFGNKLGEFMEWDDTEESRWGSFIRLRTRIDLTKPLCRGSLTTTGSGEPNKVFFRYERLMDYCYTCGHLGHAVHDCDVIQDDEVGEDEEEHNYGPWLRASPMKKHSPSTDTKRSLEVPRKLVFKPVAGASSDGSVNVKMAQACDEVVGKEDTFQHGGPHACLLQHMKAHVLG